MAIVFDTDLMAQLGLTADNDATLVASKIEAAQNHIERLLGFRIEEVFGGVEQEAIPPALKEAVLQLAAWWFENRDAGSDISRTLPFGVEEIVNEYREWTF